MRFLVVVLAWSALALGGCKLRDAIAGSSPSEDAKAGAAIGTAIGGQQGGVIGAAIAIGVGLVIRSIEKRQDRKAYEKKAKGDES